MPPCVRRLLPTLPPGASDYSAAWLQQRGVELLLGQRLEDLGEVMQQVRLCARGGGGFWRIGGEGGSTLKHQGPSFCL